MRPRLHGVDRENSGRRPCRGRSDSAAVGCGRRVDRLNLGEARAGRPCARESPRERLRPQDPPDRRRSRRHGVRVRPGLGHLRRAVRLIIGRCHEGLAYRCGPRAAQRGLLARNQRREGESRRLRLPPRNRALRGDAECGGAGRDPRPPLERTGHGGRHRPAGDGGREPLDRVLVVCRKDVSIKPQRALRPLQRASRHQLAVLAGRLHDSLGLEGRRHAAAAECDSPCRRHTAGDGGRPAMGRRPHGMAPARSERSAAPTRRLGAHLQLQRLQQRDVLESDDCSRREVRAGRRRGDRRERLRERFHRNVHALGGSARCLIPRLDVGHLELQERPGAHLVLRRHTNRVRRRLQETSRRAHEGRRRPTAATRRCFQPNSLGI